MNRRQLLATVAASTVFSAGCSSISGENTAQLSTDSEITKQASNDYRPGIGFRLTNESDNTITVSANNLKPFVKFPRLTGDSGTLVLLPTNSSRLNADVASTRTNGCWRFVDAEGNETHIVYETVEESLTLEPGESHRVNHQLYYEGEESDCFPDGDYTADHTVAFHDSENTVSFTVQVTVSDAKISGLEVRQ